MQASELATCVHGMGVVILRAWDGLAAQVLLECHLGRGSRGMVGEQSLIEAPPRSPGSTPPHSTRRRTAHRLSRTPETCPRPCRRRHWPRARAPAWAGCLSHKGARPQDDGAPQVARLPPAAEGGVEAEGEEQRHQPTQSDGHPAGDGHRRVDEREHLDEDAAAGDEGPRQRDEAIGAEAHVHERRAPVFRVVAKR
eukprot:scaffold30973_cov69-Phaeocystis_antarctica.AAC.9